MAQSSVVDASSVEVVMELGGEVMHPLLSLAVTGAAVLSCAEILGLPINRWLAALLAGVMGNAVMQALGLYEIAIPVLAFGSAMVLTMVSNALARVYREPVRPSWSLVFYCWCRASQVFVHWAFWQRET